MTIIESLKWVNPKYFLAIVYLSLILFIGFSNLKLGIAQYYILEAKNLKSDEYALKAINIDNSSPDAYNIRGLLFLRDENYANALENFEKASKFRPNDFYLWINIGYSRYKTNDFAGAEQAYQKSLNLAPNYAQPNRYWGRFLLNSDRIEKGFEYLGKAAQSDLGMYPEILHLARKQFPEDPLEIEKSIPSNDVKTKKILANYLIKHHMMTNSLKTFLTGDEINTDEKNEFIKYLIKKKEFQLGYDVWASINNHKSILENKGNNLIFDGGFENLTENEDIGFGWKITRRTQNLAVYLDEKIRNSGAKSIKIRFDGQSKSETKLISQLIIVKPNQKYRLSFEFNSSDLITGGLPLLVVTETISNKVIGQSKLINSTSNKWLKQTVEFRTNETSALNLELQRAGCNEKTCPILGELWLDDFTLEELK